MKFELPVRIVSQPKTEPESIAENDTPCPNCNSLEAVRIAKIVTPGKERVVGHAYGCLRCSVQFGVLANGVAFVSGDRVRAAKPVPREARVSSNGPATDTDMAWR